MKKLVFTLVSLAIVGVSKAQTEETNPDTLRMKFGEKEVIVISPKSLSNDKIETISDSIYDAAPDDEEYTSIEAHWAGLEFGPTILMNPDFKSEFPNDPQWENDPGKSFSWNLNFAEHKFSIYKNYIGLTTGLGVNWTQIGLRQYNLNVNNDSLWVTTDTINDWKKNKLRAIYLQAPLMLEFATADEEGFYFAAGVIGGIRIGSSVKRTIEKEKRDLKEVTKGAYALNTFKLDLAARVGYNNLGFFASYNILPMFDTKKTVEVHPLVIGATLNF